MFTGVFKDRTPSRSSAVAAQDALTRILQSKTLRAHRFARCAELVRASGGTVVATTEIYDRMEALGDLGVPNVPLAEYKAPENYPADACPLCEAGVLITTF